MKINMPVTNNELVLKKGQILVSRTDLMGRITYVNDAFVETSGFTREELIGAEHNIVRHPDMPSAAYEDLWKTLKQLRPWQGLVKNRCKNGDYYWVEANAMPLFKDGKVYEYLSVRHPPKRDLIPAADMLYKKISAGEVKLNPTGLASVAKAISEIAITKKNAFVVGTFLLPIIYLMYRLFMEQNYILLAGVAVLATVASALSINMTKVITDTLETAITICYRLSSGGFGNKVNLKREDQLGDFLRGLYCMEVKLGVDLADFKQNLAESKRISQALDNVQSPVMVANKNFEIIYMNDSVKRMFEIAESDLRKELPNFSADKLMGSNVDLYHSSIKTGALQKTQESVKANLVIGGRHMSIIASPVNSDGERIGYVAEWQDRTHEVLVEQEIDHLVQGVKSGDLSARIKLADKEGFTKTLSEGINELTDVIESVFSDVNRVMESMAEGDLTTSITNEYQGVYAECKDNINATLAKLSEFIIQIRDAADFIDSSSQEMASGNNNLSHRAEQQAASLEETAASMEELASTVKNNAQNTVQATEVVNSASQLAQKGGGIVKSAISAMQEINESSNKIAEIIGVIDEIAFQTNLLALNASVEAARAGEQGRGFSVVATEVRNLAQRSATAAQQSNELIQNSVQKVRAGTAFVNETGAALTEIVESVAKVGDIVAHIASASSEQSAGIEQVNQAVSQMDDITQQNAALAEEAAAGSIAMSEQSTNMTQLLSFFRVSSKNGSAAARPVARSRSPAAPSRPPIKTAASLPVSKPKVESSDEWEEF
ncbi:MAG: methyl-accepting chemotaxis protein [Methylobacter sp.]|nr:methyl-accepting chemotaxis protein [Methylobacter sp.]MDP2430023.1 methyl-accepting chemotaxis protein [Methylobacter sp.]MDP3054597.1 methyl-accepting chemotaxis protein [Methylobacter sp.]MDP3362972.1 methyl-accepting chemotaxis protein [Methylobacter sp.]MDZ4220497.1 methyl-accepting chemotaxis protein [Methylobacter sp.]